MVHKGPIYTGSKAPLRPTAGDGEGQKRGLSGEICRLFEDCRGSFRSGRSYERAKALALSELVCMGRHTVTGLLATSGRQFRDWSATYRLFSRERVDPQALLDTVRRGVVRELPSGEPLVVGLDDTLVKKSGGKTPGVGWKRDPLGPPFHPNFIRAQRFLQASAALPASGVPSPARMIPIAFAHAPTPAKPSRRAGEWEWHLFRQRMREEGLPRRGAEMVAGLRRSLDSEGEEERRIVVVADGGYTNGRMIKNLPDRTTFVGRVRADAKLHRLPQQRSEVRRGRRLVYGDAAPTPEEIRQDDAVPWETARVHAAGKVHDFRIKTVSSLLWRATGPLPLRLIVIAPLSYRPRKGSRLLYRKPAYLISTDPDLEVAKVIQYYVWRWDLEVNFREEKQLIGMGEAQVRNESSVETAPAFAVASYAMLLLAACRAFGSGEIPGAIPPPKWRESIPKPRATATDFIQQLRAELWGEALGKDNFSGFVNIHPRVMKPEKNEPDLISAVLYAA